MDEQQVLIDCWRLVEKHGGRPTIKGVMRMAREVGATFDEHWGRELLRPFLEKSTPLPPRQHPVRTPLSESVHPASTPAAPRTQRGSRARGKGIPNSESLFQEAPPLTAAPEKVDHRTADERQADDAITLLRPRLEPLLSGMTWTTWRARNRRVVVDMVKAGMTPTEIDAAHDQIRDAAGKPFITMAWFQNRLSSRVPSGSTRTAYRGPGPDDVFERSPHATGATPQWGEPVNRPLR